MVVQKKVFRTAYENSEGGEYQTVSIVKAVDIPSVSDYRDVVSSMTMNGFHQVLMSHEIQVHLLITALARGAKLTQLKPQEVAMPAEPVASSPNGGSRIKGIGYLLGNRREDERKREQHHRQTARHNEYLRDLEKMPNLIERVNQDPGKLIQFQEEWADKGWSAIEMTWGEGSFALYVNGCFSYEHPRQQWMEDLLLEACYTYFNG